MDDGLSLWTPRVPAALVGQVEIGALCLGGCDLDPWVALLDPDERKRSNRFVNGRDRERFCLGRGLLRRMLGEAMNRSPMALRFEIGAHGKPRLAGVQTHAFNVSHSGDYALVAVARARFIGVDIERHRPDIGLASLARRVLTAAEILSARGHDGEIGEAGFFRAWVLKEAVLKAMGSGLSLDPLAIEIQATSDPMTASVASDNAVGRLDGWHILHLDAPDGYSAAMALCP